MKTIFIDFETYYSTEYSLRRMTPVQYILDPRFECIGAAVAEGNAPARWMTSPELVAYLKTLPERVAMVSHNALFDMCILSFRFGYVPALMIDTLSMARATIASHLRTLSLESVAAHLGIGVKGKTVHKVVGMNAAAIQAAGLYDEYKVYACDDAELCRGIFHRLMEDGFPPNELLVLDMVLRCAVQPQFRLNEEVLHAHLHAVQQAKQGLLDRCGLTSRDSLMSNDQFAEALRMLGVEPPTKMSLTTGKETWAFAKTDAAFLDLEEHENPEVQALVAARLGVKSTIEETRTERLIGIARCEWPGGESLMPIPLKYSGAHTHRLSGDWKLNMQNLPRGGQLREALEAPKGHKVVAADASQIEARLVAWFCGCTALVQQFANGEDVYSSFASIVFGFIVSKKQHPVQRFIGKTGVLGLGYNVGHVKFAATVKVSSKVQTGTEVVLSPEEAQRIVTLYRTTYHEIPAMWRRLQSIIPQMTRRDCDITIGPVRFVYEAIILPSGLKLHYRNLRNRNDEWVYDFGPKTKKIYGGAMLENIIQALAYIIVMDAAVRLKGILGRIGLPGLAMQVHDELVHVVPDDLAEFTRKVMLEEMTRPVEWAPGLPLAAEAGVGQTYGDAK